MATLPELDVKHTKTLDCTGVWTPHTHTTQLEWTHGLWVQALIELSLKTQTISLWRLIVTQGAGTVL